MFCTKCGTQSSGASQFCTNCGEKLILSVTSLQHRDPVMVLIFSIITFGIYGLYWYVKTKLEMNDSGAQIPTAWLIIIPIISIWWTWKFCEGVDQVTDGKMSGPVAFILLFLVGSIGAAIIQSSLNRVAAP